MQQNAPFLIKPTTYTSCLRRLSVSVLLGLSFIFSVPSAFAADCYSLFRKKQFVQASQCFEQEAKAIGAQPTGNNKIKKGRLLRNAALCLDRAAKRSGGTRAASHRSKAIELLQLYLKEKLCGSSSTCRATQKMLRKVKSQIGYTRITLVTNHPKATACIKASGFNACQTGALWNTKLLPKTYTVSVTYPSNPPTTRTQNFTAVPHTQKTLMFTPPVKKIGLLSIVTSDPRANILLTGGSLKTPQKHVGALWTKELNEGRYEITVVYPGQSPIKRSVQITTGKASSELFTKPGPPVVIINTTPINAQVFVNGRYMGNTGLRLKLKPGTTKIEIKRGCYEPVTRTLQLAANKETYISVMLKRDPIYLAWSNKKNNGSSGALGWASLIGGVALAGAGGAMYGVAGGKRKEALDVRPSNFKKYQGLASENNTFVTIGHIGLGLGVVGIGVGVATLLMSRPQSKFSLACKVKLKDED